MFTPLSLHLSFNTTNDIFMSLMEIEKLYSRARKRHGQLAKDVVHDLYVKFGDNIPSDAYLTTCIQHARPSPVQQESPIIEEDNCDRDDVLILHRAMENVRNKYELEVDTFLECCVNGTYQSFSRHSGLSCTILKKICTFARQQIRKEYERLA